MTRVQVTEKYREKFYRRCEPDLNSGCWLWTGAAKKWGYGHVATPIATGAHRMSYLITKGEIPAGLVVRHKCDTPACVNPEHLLLGTMADNVRDRDERGRTSRDHAIKGEAHVNAVLTEAIVRDIRAAHAAGEEVRDIAKRLGIRRQVVSRIHLRQRWKHI